VPASEITSSARALGIVGFRTVWVYVPPPPPAPAVAVELYIEPDEPVVEPVSRPVIQPDAGPAYMSVEFFAD